MPPTILTNQYLGGEKFTGANWVTTKVNFGVQKRVSKMGSNDLDHTFRELLDTFWTSKNKLFHFREKTRTKRVLKSGVQQFPS